jgi:SdrD B-like domain
MNHQHLVESQNSFVSKTDFNMTIRKYLNIPDILSHFLYSFFILFFPSFCVSQSTISGSVWLDGNANGMIDPLENTFTNLPVFLIQCTGQVLEITQTDSNGRYEFNNVTDGNYKVFFNTSVFGSQYVFTLADITTDNHAQANGYTACSIIDVDINNEYTLNAGLTILTSIGDKIWNDLDGNGLQNNGEPGINDVTVNLHRATDNAIVATTTSNSIGTYSFTNILPGNYFISMVTTAAYLPTIINHTNPASNSDITGNNGPNTTDVFALSAGSNNFNLDAGFYSCAIICGIIYYDGNFSNTLNINENGINGIQVRIWKIADGDTLMYDQVKTGTRPGSPSDDGYYEFCVPPGIYYIEVPGSLPGVLIAGLPYIGNNPAVYNYITHKNGINTTDNINVLSGDNLCNMNGGFYCTGSILSRVWLDINQNGVQDAEDYGLGNTAIFLYDLHYNLLDSGFTTADGYYLFDSLSNGSYFVHSVIRPEFSYTLPNMGNDNVDSDIDGTMGEGTTTLYVIDSCQHFNHVDVGIAYTALPVVWGDISVSKNKNIHTVRWSVLSEENVSHYVVTKNLTDEKNWENIGKVEARAAKNEIQYYFDDTDNYFSSEVNYRIIAVDYDGNALKSKIVTLSVEDRNLRFSVHPNPASDLLELMISGDEVEDNELRVMVHNSLGVEVFSVPISGVSKINIPVAEMTSGIYRVTLKSKYEIIQSRNVIITR